MILESILTNSARMGYHWEKPYKYLLWKESPSLFSIFSVIALNASMFLFQWIDFWKHFLSRRYHSVGIFPWRYLLSVSPYSNLACVKLKEHEYGVYGYDDGCLPTRSIMAECYASHALKRRRSARTYADGRTYRQTDGRTNVVLEMRGRIWTASRSDNLPTRRFDPGQLTCLVSLNIPSKDKRLLGSLETFNSCMLHQAHDAHPDLR